jgi:hypothetical protein
MGHTSSSKTKALQKSIHDQQQCKLRTAAFLSAVTGGAAVMQYMTPDLIKTPMYDSKLSGEAWVQELLNGHPGQFHDNLGMSKHVFQKLIHKLQMYAGLDDSKHIMKEEQVAILLHLCQTGGVTHNIREQFQCSPDTIFRCMAEYILHCSIANTVLAESSATFWTW